ncbi:GMC family oxidoreductase, partial [Microvirga sp. P5_D2]
FMDHTHIFASKLVPSPRFPLIYNRKFAASKNLNANISFRDDFLRKEGLLQYYCRFNPRYATDEVEEAAGDFDSGFLRPGSLEFIYDVGRILADPVGASEFILAKRDLHFALPPYFELEHRLEQAPNRDSRVVISDQRDALQSPVADLDWRLNEHDYRSFKAAHDKLATELSALGLGRVQLEEITPELVRSRVQGHYHQIGTTRMSDEPKDGVVDRDCRVHGVGNLYIGGSSVFPTAGYSGPTMMIIAFAMRIADHIKVMRDVWQ